MCMCVCERERERERKRERELNRELVDNVKILWMKGKLRCSRISKRWTK